MMKLYYQPLNSNARPAGSLELFKFAPGEPIHKGGRRIAKGDLICYFFVFYKDQALLASTLNPGLSASKTHPNLGKFFLLEFNAQTRRSTSVDRSAPESKCRAEFIRPIGLSRTFAYNSM